MRSGATESARLKPVTTMARAAAAAVRHWESSPAEALVDSHDLFAIHLFQVSAVLLGHGGPLALVDDALVRESTPVDVRVRADVRANFAQHPERVARDVLVDAGVHLLFGEHGKPAVEDCRVGTLFLFARELVVEEGRRYLGNIQTLELHEVHDGVRPGALDGIAHEQDQPDRRHESAYEADTRQRDRAIGRSLVALDLALSGTEVVRVVFQGLGEALTEVTHLRRIVAARTLAHEDLRVSVEVLGEPGRARLRRTDDQEVGQAKRLGGSDPERIERLRGQRHREPHPPEGASRPSGGRGRGRDGHRRNLKPVRATSSSQSTISASPAGPFWAPAPAPGPSARRVSAGSSTEPRQVGAPQRHAYCRRRAAVGLASIWSA